MDSSTVLRQQSLNKIHNDHSRMQNEFNKMTGDPKSFKFLSVSHPTKRGVENKDPAGSEKPPGRPAISRLPVLAKSLNLQAPTDFNQSHRKWEENPFSGKTRRKKQCTKPVPFNFSHPKAHRMVENQRQPCNSIPRAGLQPTQSVMFSTTAHQHPPGLFSATQSLQSKSRTDRPPHVTTGHQKTAPSMLSQSSSGLCNGRNGPLKKQTTRVPISGSQPQTLTTDLATGPGHPRLNQAFDQSVGLPAAFSAQSKLLTCATASAQPAFTSESCLKHLNMLSLKELPKTLHDHQAQQLASSVQLLSGEAAKNRILQNVSDGGAPGSPRPPGSSQAWNFLPQRVSVMKGRQQAKPSAGPSRSVQFSPDPAALSSILQNEGLKAGGTLGATPCNSGCPPGRATSIYTAQRVPVTKSWTESAAGPGVVALNQTPARKWSPQRVPDTRHRTLSMRKLMSAHRTPYTGPPSLRGLQGHKDDEEVVQRLFQETDQEEEELAEEKIRDQETGADQPPQQPCTTEPSHSQSTAGQSRRIEDREAERSREVGQTFFQAPHRESVIFFSTGKLLLRSAPEQGVSAAAAQQPPSVRPDGPSGSGTPGTFVPNGQSNQHRGVVKKAGAMSLAAALLRRRLLPFEEMQLDEEVASYTHSPPSSCCSLQRRCGDPIASYLHSQEYTTFVPVMDDPSGPASSCSSPLWER